MAEKYCEDCRWFIERNSCKAPQNRSATSDLGLVKREYSQEYSYRWLTCNVQRSHFWLEAAVFMRSCGKRGRWFQAKSE